MLRHHMVIAVTASKHQQHPRLFPDETPFYVGCPIACANGQATSP